MVSRVRRILALVTAVLCVLASGLLLSAVPALALEPPITRQATAIKGTVTGVSAQLNGVLNPGASETAGYEFEYNTGSLSCEGGQVTSAGAEQTGKGIAVSELVEGLEGNTEYTFCVEAVSPSETLAGGPSTFLTPAIAPVILVEVTLFGGPTEAEVVAGVNAENQPSTRCVFEYGRTESYGSSAPCTPSAVKGPSPEQVVRATLTGLAPGTSYHYRLLLANATGTSRGVDEVIETPPALKPVVEAESASSPSPNEVTLNATVDPEYQEASCNFEYGADRAEVEAGKGTVIACNPPQTRKLGSGTGVGAEVAGLAPATKYYYRVALSNAAGAATGNVEEVETLALRAPVVEYQGGTRNISLTEATLEGVGIVYPGSQPTTCHFEYSATKLTVEEGHGTSVPCNPETLSELRRAVPVTAAITGLSPSTTYYFQVVATNGSGTTRGGIEEFTTGTPEPPKVESVNASPVTLEEELLSASVNPDYQATTSCEFQYGKASVAEHEVACVPATLNGGPGQSASVHAPGLQAHETYKYRVVVKTAVGEAKEEGEFTTVGPEIPEVTGEKAVGETLSGVTLQAEVNPKYQETSCEFEYSTNEEAVRVQHSGLRVPCSPASLPAGNGFSAVTATPAGLTPGETYYYAAIAHNPSGTATLPAALKHFKTLTEPVVTTDPAQLLGINSAALSGTINPEGVQVAYHWDYINTERYEAALLLNGALSEVDPTFNPYAGGVSTPETSIPSGERAPLPIEATINTLAPGITYRYALVVTTTAAATNSEGRAVKVTTTVMHPGGTFTTPTAPPELGPVTVSGITASSAVIAGSVNAQGQPTRWELQLGVPGDLQTEATGHTTGAASEPIEIEVGSLAPGTTYRYKITAQSPDGTVEAGEGAFTTQLGPPPPTLAAVFNTPLLALPKIPVEEPGTSVAPAKKKVSSRCPRGRKRTSRGRCVKSKAKSKGKKTKGKK